MGQTGRVQQERREGCFTRSHPPSNKAPPMRILGSTFLPVRFPSGTRVQRMTFRVVDGLPYGLIVGADYVRDEEGILDFGPAKGLKHSQNAP